VGRPAAAVRVRMLAVRPPGPPQADVLMNLREQLVGFLSNFSLRYFHFLL
jgi:hypothetical protein